MYYNKGSVGYTNQTDNTSPNNPNTQPINSGNHISDDMQTINVKFNEKKGQTKQGILTQNHQTGEGTSNAKPQVLMSMDNKKSFQNNHMLQESDQEQQKPMNDHQVHPIISLDDQMLQQKKENRVHMVDHDQDHDGDFSPMSDIDYENRLPFSESFSELSLEDIPTFDSNQVLEQYKRGGTNCRQIYQLLRHLQQNEDYDQILSILWEMKKYSDSYVKFFGNMHRDLMDNLTRLENEPFVKEEIDHIPNPVFKTSGMQNTSSNTNNNPSLIFTIHPNGDLQQSNTLNQKEQSSQDSKEEVKVQSGKCLKDGKALEAVNDLSLDEEIIQKKNRRELKRDHNLMKSQQNSFLNAKQLKLLDNSSQSKRPKIDCNTPSQHQLLFVTTNTKKKIETNSGLGEFIIPQNPKDFSKDPDGSHDVREIAVQQQQIFNTPKQLEQEQNHDSQISKISNFSDIIAVQTQQVPTGNGRGRPRKNQTPNQNCLNLGRPQTAHDSQKDSVSDNDSSNSSYGRAGQNVSNRSNSRNNDYQLDGQLRRTLGESMQNTTAVNGLINYEQDNFFETHNCALFETKNIIDYRNFWERADTFFKIEVQREILQKLQTFYRLPEDICIRAKTELGQYLNADYLNNCSVSEAIKLSKSLQKILQQNDELFNTNYSTENKRFQNQNSEIMSDFKEDLKREKIMNLNDGKFSKSKLFKSSAFSKSKFNQDHSVGRGNSNVGMNEDYIINSDEDNSAQYSSMRRNVNHFLTSQITKMEIVEPENQNQVEIPQNDEISFLIGKLNKEAIKYKGINILHMRKLKDSVVKIRKEEKAVAGLLATVHRDKLREVKQLLKKQRDIIARQEQENKKKQERDCVQSSSQNEQNMNRRSSEKQVFIQPETQSQRQNNNERQDRLERRERLDKIMQEKQKKEESKQEQDKDEKNENSEKQEKSEIPDKSESHHLIPITSRQGTFQDLFVVNRGAQNTGVSQNQSQVQSQKHNKNETHKKSENMNSMNSSPEQAKSSRIIIPLGNPSSFQLNVQTGERPAPIEMIKSSVAMTQSKATHYDEEDLQIIINIPDNIQLESKKILNEQAQQIAQYNNNPNKVKNSHKHLVDINRTYNGDNAKFSSDSKLNLQQVSQQAIQNKLDSMEQKKKTSQSFKQEELRKISEDFSQPQNVPGQVIQQPNEPIVSSHQQQQIAPQQQKPTQIQADPLAAQQNLAIAQQQQQQLQLQQQQQLIASQQQQNMSNQQSYPSQQISSNLDAQQFQQIQHQNQKQYMAIDSQIQQLQLQMQQIIYQLQQNQITPAEFKEKQNAIGQQVVFKQYQQFKIQKQMMALQQQQYQQQQLQQNNQQYIDPSTLSAASIPSLNQYQPSSSYQQSQNSYHKMPQKPQQQVNHSYQSQNSYATNQESRMSQTLFNYNPNNQQQQQQQQYPNHSSSSQQPLILQQNQRDMSNFSNPKLVFGDLQMSKTHTPDPFKQQQQQTYQQPQDYRITQLQQQLGNQNFAQNDMMMHQQQPRISFNSSNNVSTAPQAQSNNLQVQRQESLKKNNSSISVLNVNMEDPLGLLGKNDNMLMGGQDDNQLNDNQGFDDMFSQNPLFPDSL
eukprot:403331289